VILDSLTEAFQRFLFVEAPLLMGFRPTLSARIKDDCNDVILRLDVMRWGLEFHAEMELPYKRTVWAQWDPKLWPYELDSDFRYFAEGAARELGKLAHEAD
jgi:hypothetical protein